MTTALYPGTFDPVTNGHLDIVTRASKLFDKVVAAVYATPSKNLMLTTDERVALFKQSVKTLKNVEVISYRGLTVTTARKVGAKAIVRGLRMGSDFEHEFELALMNKQLALDIETVCLMSSLEYQFVSSSLLKEANSLGGNISKFVPQHVAQAMAKKFKK
ncbi:MAG: pantetheine-phosphate adenylyltransferase [Dehalococcoidia bacterium]|nr:pantetheine-phosphate adenylyltransferase [Dehalococcoidia bacterium]